MKEGKKNKTNCFINAGESWGMLCVFIDSVAKHNLLSLIQSNKPERNPLAVVVAERGAELNANAAQRCLRGDTIMFPVTSHFELHNRT